ncbi:MAG: hypothetical protein AB1468_06370, partial [Candidatus Micrarchaeota archaeon]
MATIKITEEHQRILNVLSCLGKRKDELPVVGTRAIMENARVSSPRSLRRRLDYLAENGKSTLLKLAFQRKVVDVVPAIFALVQAGLPTKLYEP